MIMRTIRKIKRDVGTGVLICPVWPTQAWFPMLMHMLISSPLTLPSNVLSLPFKSNISHKQGRTLRLMACHLSGNSSLVEDFQATLSISCALHGEKVQLNNMKYIFKKWVLFCSERKVDPMLLNEVEVENFLTLLFNNGASYSAINTARSALSAILCNDKGLVMGKILSVKRFLNGVFRIKAANAQIFIYLACKYCLGLS